MNKKTCGRAPGVRYTSAYFGIGAAWYEEEHRSLGVPYPLVAERFERLEEMLQI